MLGSDSTATCGQGSTCCSLFSIAIRSGDGGALAKGSHDVSTLSIALSAGQEDWPSRPQSQCSGMLLVSPPHGHPHKPTRLSNFDDVFVTGVEHLAELSDPEEAF
ncbi:hypothetical protein EV363DRAFT_1301987 [Boletus edulis]|nr:hypothetical protein EV363DRAFT_1301987 [Boletus edulis]